MVARASVGNGVVIIDDTGFAKKGAHSVGVARQYSGTLGRVDNCQVLVTAHYVDRVFDWPITAQLYLPEEWRTDAVRRAVAQVPPTVRVQTKGAIALDLLDAARAAGVAAATVVSDAGYGAQPTFLYGRPLGDLLELMHVRWVVERFYQDAKGELGLDAYEGCRCPGPHRRSPAPARGFPPSGLTQRGGVAALRRAVLDERSAQVLDGLIRARAPADHLTKVVLTILLVRFPG